MKKLCLIGLTALLVCLFLCNAVAFAQEETDNDYKTTEIYRFVEEFLTACPSRYGAEEEWVAANYLKQKFDAVLKTESQIVAFGEDENAGYNLVAEVKCSDALAKTVVIGAHYDSTGVGANDNACGVAALYFAMSDIANSTTQLPFNVTFVAFGGEERGLLGSQNYVASMSEAEKQNILVAFDIDVIVNGDNLYVFCENKRTILADLILSNASVDANLTEKPYAKGIYADFDVYGYGYYEAIQGSDCTSFRLEGIPTVLFFSGNYPIWDYVESVDSVKNNMNTNSDTLENLNENNGDVIVRRIQNVASAIADTVLSENFLDVAENARAELMNNSLWFDALWPKLILFAVLVVLAIVAFMYYRKLEKRSMMNPAEAKNTKVFQTPDADDIFTFQDKVDDECDDIFQLKK